MKTSLTIFFFLVCIGFAFSQETKKSNLGTIESQILEERIKGYNELKLKIEEKSNTEPEKEGLNERLAFLEVQVDKLIEKRYLYYNESPKKNKAEIEAFVKTIERYNPKIAKEIHQALNEK